MLRWCTEKGSGKPILIFISHFQMFVEELLRSGSRENITVAEELITPSKLAGNSAQNKKQEYHLTSALYLLKYDVLVSVVLEASREYFNAAMSGTDSSMELARYVIILITNTSTVESLFSVKSFSVSQKFKKKHFCLKTH